MILRRALQDMEPYVPGRHLPGAIKLASNENPLGPSPLGLEALRDAAGQTSLYPDGACTRLVAKVAERLERAPSEIIVGNGSDEVIVLAAAAYVESGTNTVTSEHTFSEYAFATKLFGGVVRRAAMAEGQFQLEGILRLCDGATRIVWLCNPNNPTGTHFGVGALNSFLAEVSPTVRVVVDEAYNEYAVAENYPDAARLVSQHPNLLVLRTFSKIYGLAGLRVGYGVAQSQVIEDLSKARAPFPVNSLAQVAAAAALDDEDFLRRSRACNEEGKVRLMEGMRELGLEPVPTQANFVFVEVGMDGTTVFQRMMERGVTVRPLKSFGFPTAIRVTVGTAPQNEKFLECLSASLNP